MSQRSPLIKTRLGFEEESFSMKEKEKVEDNYIVENHKPVMNEFKQIPRK